MQKHERLKMVREYLGLSQRQLSKITNIHNTSISGYELYSSRTIRDEILIFYHQKGFSLEWILTGEGEMIREGFNPKPEPKPKRKPKRKLKPKQKNENQTIHPDILDILKNK